MPMWMVFAIGVGVIVVVAASMIVFGLLRNFRTAQGPTLHGKYPQGHWMNVGMCIGIALGCVPSLAGLFLDQMSSFVGIGPALGLGVGVAIGSALERRHKDELRPLTEDERRARFRLTQIGLAAVALLVVSLFVLGGLGLFASR